jgi:hypothetical protein
MAKRPISLDWKPARGQRDKFADGPRLIAKRGRYQAEVFEWCSIKPGRNPQCPSGEFSYVITERGRVTAAGPHAGSRPLHASIEAAQRAAEARILMNPRGNRARRR